MTRETLRAKILNDLENRLAQMYNIGVGDGRAEMQPQVEEAYQNGLEAKLSKEWDEAYRRGLNDAWETARRLETMQLCQIHELFPEASDSAFICNEYSAETVIQKLKAYEERKKAEEEAEIKVGDWVKNDDESTGIVTFCNEGNDNCDVIWSDGSVGENWPKDNLIKLDRPFYPMANLLMAIFKDEE